MPHSSTGEECLCFWSVWASHAMFLAVCMQHMLWFDHSVCILRPVWLECSANYKMFRVLFSNQKANSPARPQHRSMSGPLCLQCNAGVLLYVIMAGNLPFDEPNLPILFKKISRAEYSIPTWFTPDMISLLKAMLNPSVKKRYAFSRTMAGACAHIASQTSQLVCCCKHQSEACFGSACEFAQRLAEELHFQVCEFSAYILLTYSAIATTIWQRPNSCRSVIAMRHAGLL